MPTGINNGITLESSEEEMKKKYVKIIEEIEPKVGREEANIIREAFGYKKKPVEGEDGK